MIDFKNTDKYSFKISEQRYDIKIGDKVRCYDQDSNDLNHFIGYAIVTEIYGNNVCWCEAEPTKDQPFSINYSYYCIPIKR